MWAKVDIEEVLHRDNITLIGDVHEPVIEEQKETIVGQLLWLEKLAHDGDAEMLQQQLQDLGVDDDSVHGNGTSGGGA